MISRQQVRNFDVPLLLLGVGLAVYGLVVIYSATHFVDYVEDPFYFVKRQSMWLAMGLAGIFVVCLLDYINLYYWSRYIYLFAALLLVLVLIFGEGTARDPDILRWIRLGFIDVQPSEYAKPALILMVAKYLSDKQKYLGNFWNLLPAFLYTLIFMGLIFLQPDLGTSLVFAAILLGCLLVAGIKRSHLMAIIGAGIAFIPVLWQFMGSGQKARLLVFIDRSHDPLGAGYQLLQSIIAVGSGGPWGRGMLEGPQVQGGFIPEQHTDFIFSVLAEELGLIGAILLLLMFFFLIYRILWIGTQAKDTFGTLICTGVAVMLVFQVVVNVGMAIGVMPITGLPLPFFSYGGNALLANFLSLGLVLNVGMRRQKIQF